MDIDRWKRFAWLDESQFIVQHLNGRVNIHLLPRELLRLLVQHVTHKPVMAIFGNIRNILMDFSETCESDRTDDKNAVYHYGLVTHPYMVYVYSVGKGNKTTLHGAEFKL